MIARLTLLVGLAAATVAAPAAAQRTTEQFIPLGKSPGVSGIMAYMGTITEVNPAAKTVTISGPRGVTTMLVTGNTRIWLDRATQRRSTTTGKLTDLKVGWTAEMKYLEPDKKKGAEWIKVAMPAGAQ
jgi:hypothetical protein